MAKQSGLAWDTLSVDNAAGTPVDIRNDVTNFDYATPRAVQDVTGIDKEAMERLVLLADFTINLNGVFNIAVSHSVLKTVPSTSVVRTVSTDIDGEVLAGELLFTDYQVTRGNDGALTWTSPGVLANGAVPTWT